MNKNLIITLENMQSDRDVVYVGDHVRASTATSVILLNPDTLVCCHFDGCKIFLVNFNLHDGTYNFIDSLDTTFNGQKTSTDLMATDGHGNLLTSNFFHKSCTFYRFENNKIEHAADINHTIENFVHGVKYYNRDIVAVTSRNQSGGVHFIDRKTHKVIFRLNTPDLSVQDICFLSDNRLVMVSGNGSPELHSSDIYSSVLHVVDFSMNGKTASVVKAKVFEASHLDQIALHQNNLYFTDQYNNEVICLDAETLEPSGHYENYDFPHGIDVNHGIIAVTNYGSNTVELRSLSN
ncbi:MAG: hypothetical protein V7744_17595 [Pseudomonadales bacterium]